MSNYDINNNQQLVKKIIDITRQAEEERKKMPDSVLHDFRKDLSELGFSFEIVDQVKKLMPKYKNLILPIVIKYYKVAKIPSEKQYLLSWFHYKGLEEVVPMLIEDFIKSKSQFERWEIGDRLYQICSKKHIEQYLSIIANSKYGSSRQMVILLFGKIKEEQAIPILIDLLDDEEVQLHALTALGNYKKEELRPYFERFLNSKRTVMRNQAKKALDKLG